jgi:hypothetical protein
MTAQEDHRRQPGSSTPTPRVSRRTSHNDRIYGITEYLLQASIKKLLDNNAK